MKGPGWPDMRGWVAIGLFVLSAAVLLMIRENPRLLANASFMQVVQSIVGAGGLGLVLTFLFGASKGAKEANDRTDRVLELAAGDKSSPQGQGGADNRGGVRREPGHRDDPAAAEEPRV